MFLKQLILFFFVFIYFFFLFTIANLKKKTRLTNYRYHLKIIIISYIQNTK